MTVITEWPLITGVSSFGSLTNPVRVGDSGAAVLLWRDKIYVLFVGPGGGCPQCLRWFLTRQPAQPGQPDADVSALWRGLGPALRLVVIRLITRVDEPGTLAVIDRATGTVQPGRVPPWSACPACAPSTTGTGVEFGHESLPVAPGTLRSPHPLPATLTSDYVAPHALFREPLVDLDGPVPAAQVGLPLGTGDLEPGIGRCRTVAQSRRTAVLEALERYTGFHHRGYTIEASLHDLGADAIDPRALGYHSPDQYARPGFPFTPLGTTEVVPWTEVTPVDGGPARWLPTAALSWARRPGARSALFYDTSNGFALGQSPQEAVLHGILELVERDAFLLTWYRKLLLPELVLGDADRDLVSLVNRVEVVTGFRIRLYWAALDTDIPVVIALARRDADTGPCTFVSAGANLYPASAAESAVFEVAAILSAVVLSFDAERGAELAADFHRVRTMADHSLLGALPEAKPWYDFLTTGDRPELSLADVTAPGPVFDTLEENVEHVRSRLATAGSPVYAADLTTSELRWRGLVCTRAFAPGLLPMTFGHDMRRITDLPRLHRNLPHDSLLPPGQGPEDVPPHPFP